MKDPVQRTYINNLLQLDYMGRAEYEFDSIGKALHQLVANAELFQRVTCNVTGRPRERWSDDLNGPEETVTLFGIVVREHAAAQVADIQKMAASDDAYRGAGLRS